MTTLLVFTYSCERSLLLIKPPAEFSAITVALNLLINFHFKMFVSANKLWRPAYLLGPKIISFHSSTRIFFLLHVQSMLVWLQFTETCQMFVNPRVWSRFSRLHQNSESLIALLDDFGFENCLSASLCHVFQLFFVISEQKSTFKVHSDDGDKLSKSPRSLQKTNKSSLPAV